MMSHSQQPSQAVSLSVSISNLLASLFQTKNQTRSYIFIIISCFTWVYGYVYANEYKFTPIETNLSRSIVIVFGSYPLCKAMGVNMEYKSPKTWNTLIKRHLAFMLQGFVVAGMQFVLPLGILHTIATAGPIFTLIMQKILHKDSQTPITRKKLQTCLIVIIGIFLTSNGKSIYSCIDDSFVFTSSFQNYVSSSYTAIIFATLIMIITMLVWSYGVLITQQAQCHSFAIVFHFGVMNLIVNALGYMTVQDKRPAGQIYESLFWIGGFLFLAQVSFTVGINIAENIGLTMVTGFTVVVVGYAISIFRYLFLNRRYGQNIQIFSVIGTILVLGGVGSIILTTDLPQTNQTSQINEIQLKQSNQKQVDKQKASLTTQK